LNAALGQFNGPDKTRLMVAKANVLIEEDSDAAVSYLKSIWPPKLEPGDKWEFYLTESYVRALRAGGQHDAIVELVTPMWMDKLRTMYYPSRITDDLTGALAAQGKVDAALGYAKMGWMLASFDKAPMDYTSQVLVKTWVSKETGRADIEAFAKAQTDAMAANPLKDVATPFISEEEMRAQLRRPGDVKNDDHQRITIFISAGKWREAMLAARALSRKSPGSTKGVLQACRIFKAYDLNLVRANAFLEWMKNPEGDNPVDAFLEEHPSTLEGADNPAGTPVEAPAEGG
jgi:hypothetical protein